ncbi:MAG: NYN domain-containing protein [Chlamydiota bacterium]
MHYLIDGYNFFFRIQQDVLPLAKKRRDFIAALDQLFVELNLSCTLVFDSGRRLSDSFPSKQMLTSIEVVFSPANTSADDYIIEWLTAQRHRKQLTVVTSDRELACRAKTIGAKTESLEEFFRFLRKKEQRSVCHAEEEKAAFDSEAEFNRLLKIFEQRLKE